MSVQMNQYFIVGHKMDYNEFHQHLSENISVDDYDLDFLDDYRDSAYDGIHHHKGLCVIDDGMNGEYAIIGRVIDKSENHMPLDGCYNLRVNEFRHKTSELTSMVSDMIRDQFKISNPDVNAYILTHYR